MKVAHRRASVLAPLLLGCVLQSFPLYSDNGDRPYSDGPVTADDFKGTPPPPDDTVEGGACNCSTPGQQSTHVGALGLALALAYSRLRRRPAR